MDKEFISHIYGDYLYTIISLIRLIGNLKDNNSKRGHYFSLIIIIIASIEGIINLLNNNQPLKNLEKFEFYKGYIESLKNNEKVNIDDIKEIEEIFIIRDSLIHGHLYDYNIDNKSGKIKNVNIIEGFGDKKFKTLVDNKKTKTLGINVFPDKIDEIDLKTVLRFYYSILKALSNDKKYGTLFKNTLQKNDYNNLPLDTFENIIVNYLNTPAVIPEITK